MCTGLGFRLMAGRGPAPKENRRRANVPERGEYSAVPVTGWRHGDIPPCPARSTAARATWASWMGSWFASHWSPEDLPNLRLVIRLWSKCDAGKATGSERSELRQLMDSYGITLKGQQDRRWTPPKAEDAPEHASGDDAQPDYGPYGHLRAVV